jgi:hypothetical protein
MKFSVLILFLFASLGSLAQLRKDRFKIPGFQNEKYFSFSPFSVGEPQLALGLSFGNRFSERSEYFIETAYIGKTPFYDWRETKWLHGTRMLLQYRYHFLQQWRPLIKFVSSAGNRERRRRTQPFIGLEFRYKPFSFSSEGTFINAALNDTLSAFPFKANAITIGGALIFGSTFNLSANERWKLELTAGFGAKQRIVNLKTVPSGYKAYRFSSHDGPIFPLLYEDAGLPIFPCAIRLRYIITD